MSIFNKVKPTRVPSSTFNMSHDYKTSFDAGQLIPCMNMEVLPGDTVTLNNEFMARMAPMINPIMHNVDVTIHYFYVPYRLVWPGWDDFIKSLNDPGSRPPMPYAQTMYPQVGTLANYLGIPVPPLNPLGPVSNVQLLHFAAYQFVWDQFYKDQNVASTVPDFVPLNDGANNDSYYQTLRRRAWQHDYFTSALPWEQFGAAVRIPVTGVGGGDVVLKNTNQLGYMRTADGSNLTGSPFDLQGIPDGSNGAPIYGGGKFLKYDPAGSLEVGNINVTGGTINDLRRAFSLQRISEKLARFGRRVNEFYQGIWGVDPGDARLDRPEFLGGVKNPMVISEVLQTSESTDNTPQGNMAGHGISVGGRQAFRYHVKEFGVIMAMATIMPRTAYFQGIPKKFTRLSPFDFAFPDFAQIGEEAILNKELYYNEADELNEGTFGYIPRYTAYKFEQSRVTGEMQTNLDSWHWSRQFLNRPVLNDAFIECSPDKRIFAVQTEEFDSFYAQIYHNVYVRRNLPYYSDPV